ncbi:biotin-dependent carboxyltransferase family protein [Demequina sp. SO4-13]|uniref:5-oxoprolinase subunit C family protein n=1 Tax=Demequina sp. SO4-13 TaxID=3401027 RepID=UPI003AF92C1E
MSSGLEVVDAGTLTTIQDRGRPGLAHLGVPRSGAVDARAAALANRLVGNDPAAAVLEVTATGCMLRATGPLVVAVTGAPCPVFVGWVPAPFGSPVRLTGGQTLELGAPAHGMHSYVAVRGGIDVEPVLGSRSTDTLSGLGPAPLVAEDRVPVAASEPLTDRDFAALRDAGRGSPVSETSRGRRRSSREDARRGHGVVILPLRLGPRDDWFTEQSLVALVAEEYTVSVDSNRVGLRLTGAALEHARDGELASEGLVLGAVQVPPSGQPVVFLADHPTTGGYPVVGVIDAAGLAAAAQARPGDRVRFEIITD